MCIYVCACVCIHICIHIYSYIAIFYFVSFIHNKSIKYILLSLSPF